MGTTPKSSGTPAAQWAPRMKEVKPPSAATSDSAKMAQLALANMKTIDKVRSHGGDVDQAYARLCRAERSGNRPPPASTGVAGLPPMIRWAALAVVVCGTLVGVGFALRGGLSRSHSVAGTLTFEKRAIANAKVVFHTLTSGQAVRETTTSDTGSFQLTALTPGVYKVTVHSRAGSKLRLPSYLTRPESTPYFLTIRKDLHDVAMTAMRE